MSNKTIRRAGTAVIISVLFTFGCNTISVRFGDVQARETHLQFKTYDGYDLFGTLTLPAGPGEYPVVIYVQTAEGATADMRRSDGRGGTINYLDLFRENLAAARIGFFSYEGRGIRGGANPPRYERIDWAIYNTSSLDNKVQDIITAVREVKKQKGVDPKKVFSTGTSEGTLLATMAAEKIEKELGGLVLYSVMAKPMRETFTYIQTDGKYKMFYIYLDMDKDGKISESEFTADRYKFLKGLSPAASFSQLDLNKDGFFTDDEMREINKNYVAAVEHDDFTFLDSWAKKYAAVATPANWFIDQFSKKPIWEYLKGLSIPVGIFHGTSDYLTSVEYVYELEKTAIENKKKNMQFFYFENHGHDFGGALWIAQKTLSPGRKAMFEYITRLAYPEIGDQ